ncbi:unconventional myosin-Ib-like isoform X5 [Ictidomys tridecemlineatus]
MNTASLTYGKKRVASALTTDLTIGDHLPKSLEGFFIYEEEGSGFPGFNRKGNDAIVVEQWTVIEQQKRYQQIKSSALVIQSYILGWKARKILRELKHQKRCKEAATTIAAYWHGTQARRELRWLKEEARNKHAIAVIWAYWLGSKARRELKRLKEEARRKHAVAVIWAYWLGLKVQREYRKFFRANAGKKIYEFMLQRIVQKYFLEMKNKMPSLSPIDKNWPSRPYLFLDSTHKELKRIFHLWRFYVLKELAR